MRADVLVLRGASAGRRPTAQEAESPLFSYAVPERLAAELAPGQLVAVPFGERAASGVVWALDAGDDAGEIEDGVGDADDGEQGGLRELRSILLAEPLIPAPQRALAEWIADYYAAPLDAAARLFLPPGLLPGVRSVLRPRPVAPDVARDAGEDDNEWGDAASVLGLLRERGRLERHDVETALGLRRARAAIGALMEREQAALSAELTPRLESVRRVRHVRLTGSPETLETWRAAARARLDALPPLPKRRPRWQTANTEERQAERILRQLAVLDVLGRGREGGGADRILTWSVEELRKLTRVTQPALEELERAGLVDVETVEVRRDPLAGRTPARTEPLPLTTAQREALETILHLQDGESGRVILLHGITGSGKTEVYLQALAAAIAEGKRGIVLVPEIALTPQAMARYAGRFPGRVALLHSGLSEVERLDEWRRIRAGAVDVVLGSRSALFAPLVDVGLIVVDEEHEAAYKQDRTPTYSAREAAVKLGRLAGATVVLGSATPSVESYWLAAEGAYQLVELRERAPSGAVDGSPAGLPPVTLVDLRAELRAGNMSILSEALCRALRETLERGEQAILFLNRRGTASSVVCRECGYVAQCRRCDVSLTFHAAERALLCHYCGRREPPPRVCPVCQGASIRYFGLGTERVEAAVKRQFPRARVLRWDRDTARTRQAHEELLRAFSERRADVLVGTQMIAKGLDLPAVTLVGVVSADVALFLPDFRASERAFQLLTQVAGRAGRGEAPGRVLVQTFNPEHFCIQAAARHDYATFFAAEVAARQRYAYPPFRRFVKWTYEHADRYTAQVEATVLAERLEALIRMEGWAETDVVGPAPAFLERLRGRYRWQVILRSPDPRAALRAVAHEGLPRGWSVDVDPAATL
jgi:primosomal protein N' (replication factor Y) (superfamily II helicase)